MKYIMIAIYGGLAIIFFCLTFCKSKGLKEKEKAIYKPYDSKVKKIIPFFVKLSGVLFGICMLGFLAAAVLMPGGLIENAKISTLLYSVFAYALLIPVGIVVLGWIWMQFYRKKGKK